MADVDLEEAGLLHRHTDIGASTVSDEAGGFRRTYAHALNLATLLAGEDQGNNILRFGLKGGGWSVSNVSSSGNGASISQASGGGTVRNVLNSFEFGYTSNGNTTPTAALLTVNLRDGASAAGTVIRSWRVTPQALVGGTYIYGLSGLWIEGSQNTAMTLEFTGGTTNVVTFVNIAGVTIAA